MSGIAEFTSAFFDEASAAWRANKRALGEGMFKYVRPRRIVVPVHKPKKVAPILETIPTLRRSPRFSRAT